MKTKLMVVLCAALLSTHSSAGDFNLEINGISHHFGKRNGGEWNEFNPGLGLGYQWDEVEFGAGYYHNSYGTGTWHIQTRLEPKMFEYFNMRPGVMLAAASGYEKGLVGAFTLNFNRDGDYSLLLFAMPNIMGKKNTVSVIGAQLRVKIS